MLGCNQDITVWIRKKNSIAKEIFERHILPVKCRWKNYTERNINNGAANIYNKTVIIIPYFEDISDFSIFDIKEGDIAALGVYDTDETDITGISPYTLSEVRQSLSPNITTVNFVSYNFDNFGMSERETQSPVGVAATPFQKGAIGTIGMTYDYMKGRHLRLTGN